MLSSMDTDCGHSEARAMHRVACHMIWAEGSMVYRLWTLESMDCEHYEAQAVDRVTYELWRE